MKSSLKKPTDWIKQLPTWTGQWKKLRNITISQKLQQRGWLHVKCYMAAVNYFILECSIQPVIDSQARCNDLLTWPTNHRGSHSTCAHAKCRSTHHTVGHLFISFGFTKPSVAPRRWRQRVSPWNVGELWHLDMAVCPIRFYWMLVYILATRTQIRIEILYIDIY
jgi:hypothetical protein